MNESERVEFLKKDFDRQPCGKASFMNLDELSQGSAMTSMEVMLRHCVVDDDKRCVVQGGVVATLVDFAGVYLARMHSENPQLITPLTKLEEDYYKPFVLGEDAKAIAEARLLGVDEKRIYITVSVRNEKGHLKGAARLSFAERFSKSPEKTRP